MLGTPKGYWPKLIGKFAATLALASAALPLYSDIGSALEQEGRTWTISGNPNIITLENASDYIDEDALRFQRYGTAPENRLVSIETTVEGPISIKFRWRLREIGGNALLYFEIGPTTRATLATSTDWREETISVATDGEYRLKWTYNDYGILKDGAVASWLDSVEISASPVITEQPRSTVAKINDGFTLSVTATEATPNTYLWYKNGIPIPGETNATLERANASLDDQGEYTVEISNANGNTTSNTAQILVYENLGDSVKQSDWIWTVSGLGGWGPQNEITHDGIDALAHIPSGLKDTTVIETTVNGSGEISFWRRYALSPHNQGTFEFYIDDIQVDGFATLGEWRKFTYLIDSPGDHVLKWRINNRYSQAPQLINAWLDRIQFDDKPIIAIQPAGQIAMDGEAVELSVLAHSQSPISYQWRKDGIDIASTDSDSLTLDPASVSDSGLYDVVIVNSQFQTTSDQVEVVVLTPIDEALNQTELDWSFGGDRLWVPQNDITLNDETALEIGPRNREGEGWVETEIEGPVTVTFWWKAEVLDCCGEVHFLVDGEEKANLFQTTDWVQASIEIPEPGIHKLRWKYEQRFYPEPRRGEQLFFTEFSRVTAWLDEVKTNYAPIITLQPFDSSVQEGSDVTLEAVAASQDPLSYQWFKNGTEILGATESSLRISNIAESDIANYSLLISNDSGNIHSEIAAIELYENFGDSIEQPDLDWNFADGAQWFVQNDTTIDGIDAAECVINSVESPEANWLETTIEGPFQLSFWWRVETEGQAIATMEIDGVSQFNSNPSIDGWAKEEAKIDQAGSHVIRFYIEGEPNVETRLFLDRFAISTTPVITDSPSAKRLEAGQALELSVSASSASPLEYQWFKNGAEILGANSSSYTIASASIEDAGSYAVHATNEIGTAISKTSIVRISENYGLALGQPDLVWSASDDNVWFAQDAVSIDGSVALEARVINYSPIVWFETEIEGPASISFFMKLIEEDRPSFTFSIDGIRKADFFETTNWQLQTFDLLDSGFHTIRWEIDASDSDAYEKAWVDRIRISRAPIITRQPGPVAANIGDSLAFSVEATSATTISYQWRRNGIDIFGQTNATLDIASLEETDLGIYDVVLTNANGASTSIAAEAISDERLDEALDTAEFDWAISGTGAIESQSIHTRDGQDALRIETIQSISLETEFEGPSILEFWWKTEGRSSNGFTLSINGSNEFNSNNGNPTNGEWNLAQVPIYDPGIHSLEWKLDLGDGPIDSADWFYLDQVKLTPIGSPLAISSNPRSGFLSPDVPYTLRALIESDLTVSYQWRKDGIEIPEATESTYSIESPIQSDAGFYDVVIANALVETTSRSAQLIWIETAQNALDTQLERINFGGKGIVSLAPEAGFESGDALRIDVEPGETIWIEVLFGKPSNIGFWWKADSSDCSNRARFFRNSQHYEDIYAGQNWIRVETDSVSEYSNAYYWTFTAQDDCDATFYLDRIAIEPNQLISEQPTELAGYIGEPFVIEIELSDTTGVSYQWIKDGLPISGETGRFLHINAFQLSDAGAYQLELDTPFGILYSDSIPVTAFKNIGGPIDADDRDWSVGSDGSWKFKSENAWDGVDSLLMAFDSRYDNPWLETVVEGPATISFRWWVGYVNCDQVGFYVDDKLAKLYPNQSINTGWKEETFVIKATGQYALKWGTLDLSCPGGSLLQLDAVSISQAPIFESSTNSNSLITGQSTLLEVNSPSPNVSYQWLKDGVGLPGANGSSLDVTSPGNYKVIATNEYGSSTKEFAPVERIEPIGHLIEQPDLSWDMPLESPWIAAILNVDGEDALRSPDFPIGGQSYLKTKIEGPVSLTFDYRFFGSTSRNSVYVIIGNQGFDLEITGRDWSRFSHTIEEEGTHELSISVFIRQPLDREGVLRPYEFSPRILIDNLIVSQAPVFENIPKSRKIVASETIQLQSKAIGASTYGPIAYQWYKDEEAIPGATNSSFSISGTTISDSGSYTVSASNTAGKRIRSPAHIQVLDKLGDALPHWDPNLLASGTKTWFPISVVHPEFDIGLSSKFVPTDQPPEIAILETFVEGPGTLEYYWKADVNSRYTRFTFEIDGIEQMDAPRTPLWEKATNYLEEGEHHLRWILQSNRTNNAQAWIANLKWDHLPFIDSDPRSMSVFAGTDTQLYTEVISETPATLQWFFDGQAIDGATQSTLILENIQFSDGGDYTLEATNENGMRDGGIWTVTVFDKPAIVHGQNDVEFTFSGDGNWTSPSDALNRLQSPLLGPGQESSASARIIGPALVRFDFSVFFGYLGSRFEFYVDDLLVSSFDRNSQSGPFSYNIYESGEHTLSWRVVMNEFETTGGHYLYIENLEIATDLLSVYDEWAQRLFPAETSVLDTDLQADPDGDTKSNVLEFILGSDPLVADGPIEIEIVKSEGRTYWQSQLDLIAWINGIEFTLEFSSDLKTWEPLETEFDLQDTGERALLKLRGEIPDSLETPQFSRLKLSYQASVL